MSERNISRNGWSGVGYLLVDPESGTGAYKISGGADGGVGYSDFAKIFASFVDIGESMLRTDLYKSTIVSGFVGIFKSSVPFIKGVGNFNELLDGGCGLLEALLLSSFGILLDMMFAMFTIPGITMLFAMGPLGIIGGIIAAIAMAYFTDFITKMLQLLISSLAHRGDGCVDK